MEVTVHTLQSAIKKFKSGKSSRGGGRGMESAPGCGAETHWPKTSRGDRERAEHPRKWTEVSACVIPKTPAPKTLKTNRSVSSLASVRKPWEYTWNGTPAEIGVQDLPNRIHWRSECGTGSVRTEIYCGAGQRKERTRGGNSDRPQNGVGHRHERKKGVPDQLIAVLYRMWQKCTIKAKLNHVATSLCTGEFHREHPSLRSSSLA